MKVLKFGGTSVGSAERIQSVAKLVTDNQPKIVVLSAMSGTTNTLVEITNYLYKDNYDTANEIISELKKKYFTVIDELLEKKENIKKAKDIIISIFSTIETFIGNDFNETGEKVILAQGELMSTNLFNLYLKEQGVKSELLPALDYMKTNKHNEPDYVFIKENLNKILSKQKGVNLFITQGYICKNIKGEIDNLQRGGSDYTASIVGKCINAEEIQIWTDIDGIHNNDPRYVEKTYPLDRLSFDEAAELAYFGAKILHPTSILPAKNGNIPVVLKNTMNPEAKGTTINEEKESTGPKAIAGKDGITMIKIKSGRMLLAYGFLRKVFEIFEKYKTPIDMITTSEVGVSVTIDKTDQLSNIKQEIEQYGSVSILQEQSIICMVGYRLVESDDVIHKIFDGLKDTRIHMISYGGSLHNISVLINTNDKKESLQKLNKTLFNT